MRHAQSSNTVLLLATGGTIGMHATEHGLAPDPQFAEVLQGAVAEICAPLGADYRINQLQPPIDSANADADTAPALARAVRARVRIQRPRAVVIVHGTDTLAFTAARLAFELADLGTPVVVTGSQLPYGADQSDAAANLALAIQAALQAAPGAPVSVAFDGALMPAVRTTKHDSSGKQAFRAELPLAAHGAGLSLAEAAVARAGDTVGIASAANASTAPARVIAYRFVPAVTAADVRAAVAADPDGLVLECYGSGNAPMARAGMVDALRDICATLPVVAITQCARGGVDLSRYAVGQQLAAVGVIDGSDLTLEAAIAKLGFVLDAGLTGTALRVAMQRNLIGECVDASSV